MYDLIRKFLFLFPAEGVHYFAMNSIKGLCSVEPARKLLKRNFRYPAGDLAKHLLNLTFKNPIGLAAGFDKNARYLPELEALGFGFVEIGTVTPIAQEGNAKPRLIRLPHDRALINRMGFNNDGVKVVAGRLMAWREKFPFSELIIGGNIGKNKATPNEDAWKDYEICFRQLHDKVDYFVVNVSSPNTPGLRELQEKDSLQKILSHLQTINAQQSFPKPILLKIAPDLNIELVDDIIELVIELRLDGLVVANTTVSRENLSPSSKQKAEDFGAGGLSGRPLKQKSTDLIRYIRASLSDDVVIIGSGGVFTAEDAKEKIAAGASLVQVWTGFIYQGPSIAKQICSGLKV